MQGKILDFNIQDSQGIILCEDGKRYIFTTKEWSSKNSFPAVNVHVDFTPNEDTATDIYVLGEQNNQLVQVESKQTSTAAILSLVFGLVGIFFDWWMFAIPSIIAIITGHVAKSDINNSNGQLEGRTLANIGLILGYFTILVYVFVVFAFVGLLISAN